MAYSRLNLISKGSTMNILLVILLLPYLLILYVSVHLHFPVANMIRELMQKIPDYDAKLLNANILVKTAKAFAEVGDIFNAWWFVVIPLIPPVFLILVYFLKRWGDAVAKVGVLLIINFCATIVFISLSAQMMTLILVLVSYTR